MEMSASTVSEEEKPLLRGEAALALAVVINSLGVVLMLYSGAGISAISSVPFAFSEVFPRLTLGTWTYIFQGLLVLSLMILRKQFVPSYLFSFLVGFAFSEMLDVHDLWIDALPVNLPCCVVYFIISYLLICFGIALSNRCCLPIIPTDLFPPGTGRHHRCGLCPHQDRLRCDLSGRHRPDDLPFPGPSGRAGHRHHPGRLHHGQGGGPDGRMDGPPLPVLLLPEKSLTPGMGQKARHTCRRKYRKMREASPA